MGPGLEVTNMSKQKKATTEKQAAVEQAPVVEAKPAAPKAAESKTGKKTKAKAPAKPKRTADEIMPKARAAEELVVFAFRLTPEERDAIHDAAGPARASRFVRAVALAAARRDVAQLQAVIAETGKGVAS